MRACPVAIDTGTLIKRFRRAQHGERAERAGLAAAKRYAVVERVARGVVRAGALAARVLGDGAVTAASAAARRLAGAELVPGWSTTTPAPAPQLPFTVREGAAAVYLPACINRIFGNPRDGSGAHSHPTLPEALVAASIAHEVVIPAAAGCCGMAGDRGWLHPELPASALRDVARELEMQSFDACLSSNRTCEAALQSITGRPYSSFVIALEQVTRR